jgi:hypothetical protein
MNSVHDMGGMHGMGPVNQERRTGLRALGGAGLCAEPGSGSLGKWNIDASRHTKELIRRRDISASLL